MENYEQPNEPENLEKPVERRIWQTGKGAADGRGSYITALPSSWAKNVESKRIVISKFKDCLLVAPVRAATETKHKIGELRLHGDDSSFLKYQVISAYLNNFREIYIEFEHINEECIEVLDNIPKKLLGVSPSFVGGTGKRLVSMSTMLKPIPDILSQMLSLVHDMHNINQKAMLTHDLPVVQFENMKAMENEIDRNSYLIKRLFSVATTQLELAKAVGIKDLTQLVHWETLNSNLERVGDLQSDICLELKRLFVQSNKGKPAREELVKVLHSKGADYDFQRYHNDAQSMVNDAYSNDPEKITKILNTKGTDADWDKQSEITKYRGEYIKKEQGEVIAQCVRNHQYLACLDFRIFGLTGCATNLAEAWLNMRGPAIRS